MTADGSTGRLTIKQQALLAQLLTGKSTELAAKDAGVAERTAYRWVKEPAFKEALAQAQQALFLQHLSMLRTGIRAALLTLARNMGETIPPNVQVTAARTWLEQAVTLYKVDEETKATSVLLHPDYLNMRDLIFQALANFPDARVAVARSLHEEAERGRAVS